MVDRPGVVLRALFDGPFAAIDFDEVAAARIRAAATRGPLVYVLRTVSYIEYLYFNYALRRHGLPLARYANGGLRTLLLWPVFVGLGLVLAAWRRARGATLETEEAALVRTVEAGEAALLFLRPSHRLVREAAAAAHLRGRFFEDLVGVQRRRGDERPVQLIPMTLMWGHRAVRSGARGPVDALFGEPEVPGRLRAFLQFLRHYRTSEVKVAEAVDLAAFLRDGETRSDEATARALRFEVSGRIERERRVILGPPVKGVARMRLDVLRSRRLREVIDELAARPGASRAKVERRAERLVREIAANPRAWTFAWARRVLAAVFSRMYEGIDLAEADLERLREASRRGPLVLLPSHKSHVDYLVLSYLFYVRGLAPPYVAAGANLSFFPLGFLFRRTGAFFLRRSFKGDGLYWVVFSSYVRRLLRDRFNIEFFIEGGRSRTGKVLAPKTGLLGMVCDAVLDGDAPTAQAVPISISYERLVEGRSYAVELAGGAKKKEGLGSLLKARRVLAKRYGRIEVAVGEPFGLADALAECGATGGADEVARRLAVKKLGHRITYLIAQATPLSPSAFVAAACLARSTRGISRRELDLRVEWLARAARAAGAVFSTAAVGAANDGGADDAPGGIDRALELFGAEGHLAVRGDGDEALVLIADERRPQLEYYKNTAIHALGDLSIVARAILAAGPGADGARVRELAQVASRLLKQELIYRPGSRFDAAFDATLGQLMAAGFVACEGAGFVAPAEAPGVLELFAGLTGSYLESYGLVCRVARAHPDAVAKELVGRTIDLGERALVLGEIARREAISRPLFESAVDYLRAVEALGDVARIATIERDLALVATPGEARPSAA